MEEGCGLLPGRSADRQLCKGLGTNRLRSLSPTRGANRPLRPTILGVSRSPALLPPVRPLLAGGVEPLHSTRALGAVARLRPVSEHQVALLGSARVLFLLHRPGELVEFRIGTDPPRLRNSLAAPGWSRETSRTTSRERSWRNVLRDNVMTVDSLFPSRPHPEGFGTR